MIRIALPRLGALAAGLAAGRHRGYLGKNAQFDEAVGKFALAYADQAERDHAALRAAVRAGIVEMQLEH